MRKLPRIIRALHPGQLVILWAVAVLPVSALLLHARTMDRRAEAERLVLGGHPSLRDLQYVLSLPEDQQEQLVLKEAKRRWTIAQTMDSVRALVGQQLLHPEHSLEDMYTLDSLKHLERTVQKHSTALKGYESLVVLERAAAVLLVLGLLAVTWIWFGRTKRTGEP